MAKKGNRVQVILECTEHKESGRPGTSRYITTKNKKNSPERLEIKKIQPDFEKNDGTQRNLNSHGKEISSIITNRFKKIDQSH